MAPTREPHLLPDQVIQPSSGLLIAAFHDGFVAYDTINEIAHILGPMGFIAAIDRPTSSEALISMALPIAGADASAAVAAAIDELRATHLVDRVMPITPHEPWAGSSRNPDDSTGWAHGMTHQIIDTAITFRSNDPALLARIDRYFRPAATSACHDEGDRGIRRTASIDVEHLGDGGVRVDARDRWDFDSAEGLFRQILSITNEYASYATSYATVHAGAARTPDGQLVVLPGQIDAGKSTLIAALVRAGCAYGGDESIGLLPDTLSVTTYLKPIPLSAESRRAIGLPAQSSGTTSVAELREDTTLVEGALQAPSSIVLPRYDSGASGVRLERLGTLEALRELLANTHNLGRAGSIALAAVAKAAESIPVTRIVYDDATAAAAHLLEHS